MNRAVVLRAEREPDANRPIRPARACGASGEIVVRSDSAFYARAVVWACRRNKVRFSVTARIDDKIRVACHSIPGADWVDIKYPQAIWDDDEQRWISDAQVAASGPVERLRRAAVRGSHGHRPGDPAGQGDVQALAVEVRAARGALADQPRMARIQA